MSEPSLREEILKLHRSRKHSQLRIARMVGCSPAYVSIVVSREKSNPQEWERIVASDNRDDEHVANLVSAGGFPVGTREKRWIWPVRGA